MKSLVVMAMLSMLFFLAFGPDREATAQDFPVDWEYKGTVIHPGPPGSRDARLSGAVSPITVLWWNGQYVLLYIGADGPCRDHDEGPPNRTVMLATSADMVNWTKRGVAWGYQPHGNDEEGVFSGCYLVDSGTIYAYYGYLWGKDQTTDQVQIGFGLATSSDGLTWTNEGVMVPWSELTNDEAIPCGAVALPSGYYIYYHRGWGNVRAIRSDTPDFDVYEKIGIVLDSSNTKSGSVAWVGNKPYFFHSNNQGLISYFEILSDGTLGPRTSLVTLSDAPLMQVLYNNGGWYILANPDLGDPDEVGAECNDEYLAMPENRIGLYTSGNVAPPDEVTNSLKFSWDQPMFDGLVGWAIYEGSTQGGPYLIWKQLSHDSSSSATSFSHTTDKTGVVGQTVYFVMVSLKNTGEQSKFSSEVSWTFVRDQEEIPAPLNFNVEGVE